jgi:hypothetical protein
MNKFYKHTGDGYLYELGSARTMGLLGAGETIDALIDRAIDKMPADTHTFVLEVSAQKDMVTVATGFKFKDGWRVMLGADFRKDGTQQGRIEIVKEWK